MPILATVILDSGFFLPVPDSNSDYTRIGYFESSKSVSDIVIRADGADVPCKNSMNLGKKYEIEIRHVKADGTIKQDGVYGVVGFHEKILNLRDLYDDDVPVVDPAKFDCILHFDSGIFSPALVKPRYFKKLSKQATGEFALLPEERKPINKLIAHNVHVNFKLGKGEALEIARNGEVFWSSKDVNVKERLEIEILADNTTAEKFYRVAFKGNRDSYWLPNQGDPPPMYQGVGWIVWEGEATERSKPRFGNYIAGDSTQTGKSKGGSIGRMYRDETLGSGAVLVKRGRPTDITPPPNKVTNKTTKESRTDRTRTASKGKTTFYFHGEMDEQVVVDQPTTVKVIISREMIDRIKGPASKGAKAKGAPDKRITIKLLAIENFEVVGKSTATVEPPKPQSPQQKKFVLNPTHQGKGEVWVTFHQGQIPLATLILTPTIVQSPNGGAQKITVHGSGVDASGLIQPLHQLRIIRRLNGNLLTYEYELSSPKLRLQTACITEPIDVDPRKYVEDLYREIEQRWLSNEGDAETFTAELRAYGAELFEKLFPRKLQERLWHYRNRLEGLQIMSNEPFIPWEIVYLKEPGVAGMPKEGKFLGQVGAVRWLRNVDWPVEQLRIRKGRARYVIPQYPIAEWRLLEAELEAEFLKKKFGATAVEAQPDPVRNLISVPGSFDLLHFASHGLARDNSVSNALLLLEGRLETVMKNGKKTKKYIQATLNTTTAKQYGNLKVEGEHSSFIVLNACQTGRSDYTLTGLGGFADAFLNAGAGAFVGTLWSVYDRPAREFIQALYTSLLEGSTLSDAAIKAREEARLAGDATWLAYVVYGNPHLTIKS